MTGCSSSIKQSNPPLDSFIAKPCLDIDPIESTSWDDFVDSYIRLVYNYKECKTKHETLLKLYNAIDDDT